MSKSMMLNRKIIVVAGGSGLIGKAILKEALIQNAVVLNLDIAPSKIDEIQEFCADLTRHDEVKKVVKRIVNINSRIDGFINCSYPRTKKWGQIPYDKIPYNEWTDNIDKHLNSYYFISQQILEVMKMQGNGSLLNFASIYGVVGNDFTIYEGLEMYPPAAYSAIKGGIVSLTKYLASYFGKFNIRVNCLSPGGIFDHQHHEFVKRYEERVPLKRMGKPEDIAPVACFLVSDGAGYITGQNILVDGGWTCI